VIELVIFDMDGLIIDNEAIAFDIWLSICPDQPERKSADIFLETLGWSWSKMITHFNAHYPGINAEEMCRRFENEIIAHIRREGVPLKPGLLELIGYLDSNGIQKCVATSTPRASAEVTLKEIEVYHHFGGHVYGDMVKNSKPAPDLFLLAAKTMKAAPNRSVVLEDSLSGIRAAHAAGMIPIMVPDLVQPDAETCAMLHSECKSLHDVAAVLKPLLL